MTGEVAKVKRRPKVGGNKERDYIVFKILRLLSVVIGLVSQLPEFTTIRAFELSDFDA